MDAAEKERLSVKKLRLVEWREERREGDGVVEPPSLPGDRTWTRATQLHCGIVGIVLHHCCGIVGAATHGITAIQVSHSRQHTTPPLSLDSFSLHDNPIFRIDKLQAKYVKEVTF